MSQSALLLMMASLLLLMYGTDAKMEIITSKSDIRVGDEILLLCKAGGDGDITWEKNEEEIDDESQVSKVDEASSKLIIKKATMHDAGRYTCVCDFDNGHHDRTAIEVYVYEGPSFGHTTVYHEFLEGTDGVVPCLVFGQPIVDVQWIRDQQAISSNAGRRVRQLSDHTLLIEKVKRGDAGTYICKAQIRGRPIFETLNVSVVVNAPPVVHLKEKAKKVLAGPETNVSLLCLVDGLPKPNITWTAPVPIDTSHHQFNSDRSQLTITSVTREDYGEYVCTATNKISENSATFMLHVYEAPDVFVSEQQLKVSVGDRVSVYCNVSGYPQPELYWLNKRNGLTLDSTTDRAYAVNGTLVIEEMLPPDGGLYSCVAVSISGNASRDVAIYTQPDPPLHLSVTPGPASVLLSFKTLPSSGGTPITSFVLQWRQSAAEQWKQITVPASDPLAITALKQYTQYTIRLAAMNAVGMGQYSETKTVRTLGIHGEPDIPVLSVEEMTVEKNSFSVPLKLTDDGGVPLQHFNIRYRQVKDKAEWKEMQLSSDTNSISLHDLPFGSDYQLEVTAVNANGSSIPAIFNFTIGEQPVASRSMTKGSVAGIVMVIFLVVFLAVDATCCYKNHCGLLMSIAVKLFGNKVPGIKMFEDVEGANNGEIKLKGISTPRGSTQLTRVHTKEAGLTEVTSDKASLTKHEKIQAGRELPNADA